MKAKYYKLTEDDKDAIEIHIHTFQEIDDIGFNLLDTVLSSEIKLENYKVPIRSILYRLLELNDTLKIMVENSLINTSFSLLRNEFEIYSQILYILHEKEEVEEKALLYHYCDLVRINSNFDKEILNKFLLEHKYLDSIHSKYFHHKQLNKRQWYMLYDERIRSFKDLCKKIDSVDDYNNLYPHLSADVHGIGNIELNTIYNQDDGKYYLLNFRHFERHHTLMIYHIDFLRKVFFQIISSFESDKNVYDKVLSFYNRAEKYIDTYKTLRRTILDPVPSYSI